MTLSKDAAALLAALPDDGSAVGNLRLRGELRLAEGRYRAAANELVDAGLARRGRGRGGSLARTTKADRSVVASPAAVPGTAPSEKRPRGRGAKGKEKNGQ